MSDDSHVNEFGMSRITSYMDCILSKYDTLTDHRNKKGSDIYDEAVVYLREARMSRLLREEDLYMTLGYLDITDTNFALLLRANSAAFKDDIVITQIKRLSGTKKIHEGKSLNGPYFLLKQSLDEDGDYIYEKAGEGEDSDIMTLKGTGEYAGHGNFAAFYFNGNHDENLFDMEEKYNCDCQIVIFDDDGEIIDRKYFDRHFTTAQE